MSTAQTDDAGQNKNGDDAAAKVADLQTKLDAAIAEKDTLGTQLRDLKNANKNAGSVQEDYTKLLAKHSRLEEEFTGFKTTIKTNAVTATLKTALDAAGAHNPERVKAMLDMSKLQVADDGTIDQALIATQITALKVSDSYLFKDPDPKGNEGKGQNGGTSITGQLPNPARAAGQTGDQDAYKLALKDAQKAKDPFKAIEEVMKKFAKT